ncbi:PSP1 domain-containing protein [Treponema sp. R6D11]
MSDYDEYEDEEDISALEDNHEIKLQERDVITGADAGIESIAPDAPIYRLRLLYSQETFLAVYREDNLAPNTMVIVPTRYGRDLAQVIGSVHGKLPSVSEIAWIVRAADSGDLEKSRNNTKLEKEAFDICKKKILNHKLEMKLVLVHYLLEEPKILFFFTAENRVDFRELVKDLVSVFKMRIELRQIGVRDEARVTGGLGVCGRGYCCHCVSDKLKPVSLKMAKDQKLSLNSVKISGPCGRLLCCLFYEYGFYSEQQRNLPQEGMRAAYNNETWKISEVNPIACQIKLVHEDGRLMTVPACQFERVDNHWKVKSN